jgi:hypothetical protein
MIKFHTFWILFEWNFYTIQYENYQKWKSIKNINQIEEKRNSKWMINNAEKWVIILLNWKIYNISKCWSMSIFNDSKNVQSIKKNLWK